VAARESRRSPGNRASGETASPAQSPDRAQAKQFAKILRRELAELSENIVAAEIEWHLRCESEGYVDPPKRLVAAQERIAGIETMLTALNARFPRT